MTFRQFEAFVAAATILNVTRAARQLHTSQPGVSKHLKTLEEEYGVKLFRRGGKRIELTDTGAEFLDYILPIVEQLKRLENRFLKQPRGNEPAVLSIGGTYEVSSTILPSVLALFKRRHPNIPITLRSNSIGNLEGMMLKGDPEIAISTIAPRSAELVVEPCVPLELIAFTAKGYRIRKRELSLADVERVPLIVRDNGDARGPAERLLTDIRKQGYRANVVMRCESPEAMKAAVGKKFGVGIFYRELLREDINRGIFKQLRIRGVSTAANTFVIYQTGALSSCGEVFLELVRQWRENTNNKHSNPELPS